MEPTLAEPIDDDLVLAIEQLSTVRGRMDAIHSDGSDSGGDGLNLPETS